MKEYSVNEVCYAMNMDPVKYEQFVREITIKDDTLYFDFSVLG